MSLLLISKEIRRAEREYMNMHPPPPINALVSALIIALLVNNNRSPETMIRTKYGQESTASLPWRFLKQLFNKVFSFVADFSESLVVKIIFSRSDVGQRFLVVIAQEGRQTTDTENELENTSI